MDAAQDDSKEVPPISGHNCWSFEYCWDLHIVTGKMTAVDALVATVSFPRSGSQLLSRILFVTKPTLDPGNETRFT